MRMLTRPPPELRDNVFQNQLKPGARVTSPGHYDPFHLGFISTQDAIRPALQDLRTRFEAAGLSHETLGVIELVMAEVLNNVAKHAYAGMPPGPVDLWAELRGDHMQITVCDDGRGMQGGQPPPGCLPAMGERSADLPEGGFGWFLIRDLTQSVAYTRKEGNNRLELRFSMPRPTE